MSIENKEDDKFKRYAKSQKEKGLKLIRVYVPKDDVEKVKKHCERLRKKHAKLQAE